MSTDAAQVETSSAAPWNDDTATLKAKIAALEAENLALKEQVATLTLALEDARRAA
jgi:cell division protein FtsB